ncbi:MAG: PCP reductase family protein [Leptolyngbyaceae cyanobacterium]
MSVQWRRRMLRSHMSNPIEWTPEAKARLKEIPFFVRPAARKKIERLAQESGATQITVEVYEQAKQKFG